MEIQNPRLISFRTKGHVHGPITRLISPGSEGQLTKPFVFLDYFNMTVVAGGVFAPHPHSGIATHTTFLEGSITYGDSTGRSGEMAPGSIEWMNAGGAVWHWGQPKLGSAAVRGYQLWIALPENLELQQSTSQYIEKSLVQADGPVRILLGSYENLKSPILLEVPITFLHVRLQNNESWIYQPNKEHDVAWLAINKGKLQVDGKILENELAVFNEGEGKIHVQSEGETEFVIGSSKKHPFPLVTGYSSVHTSEENLRKGEANIKEVSRKPVVQAAIIKHNSPDRTYNQTTD